MWPHREVVAREVLARKRCHQSCAGVAGIPALNQEDGIHPNRAGARIVARTIYDALVKRPLLTTATH